MRLVFYSGGFNRDLWKLDQLSLDLVSKEGPQIAFIPSCSYESNVDFYEFVQRFKKLGIKKMIHFPVDGHIDQILLGDVFRSDIIHLGGGNTYYFLQTLRKNKLLNKLKQFVRNGGILTGLSAGSILMTSNISTAGFPHFDKDENDVGIKNFSSLGLVPFEFFPHYRNSKRYEDELIKYSKKTKNIIYAVPDGNGIVVENEVLSFIGKVFCFSAGRKLGPISS